MASTASAARRADSAPIPPQTNTRSSFSKNRNRRPFTSLSFTRHSRIRGRTSRSSAATIATLDIAIAPEPFDRAPQCSLDWHDLPPQFALCLAGTGKHFLFAHAHRVHGGARLAMQYSPGDRFVDHSRRQGEDIRQLQSWRGQPRDLPELV